MITNFRMELFEALMATVSSRGALLVMLCSAHTLLSSAQHEDILIKQYFLLDSTVDTVVAAGSGEC